MNLHSIVSQYVGKVNPPVPCILEVSTGYTKTASYGREPSYASSVTVQGQVQSLSFGDLRQLDSLNLQGLKKAIYLTGEVQGLVRVDNKGGDKITFPDGSVWLVVMVLEAWGLNLTSTEEQWVKVAVTLQNGS